MEKEDQILNEIKELRSAIAKLIGSSELPVKQQFSSAALDKASAEYKKLSIERGEWVPSDGVKKIIKTAPYNTGSFLINEFAFTNYFKRSRSPYYNKQDLIALGKELSRRNIDLARYMELRADQATFKKYLETVPK
jgi:hypothetical protein